MNRTNHTKLLKNLPPDYLEHLKEDMLSYDITPKEIFEDENHPFFHYLYDYLTIYLNGDGYDVAQVIVDKLQNSIG